MGCCGKLRERFVIFFAFLSLLFLVQKPFKYVNFRCEFIGGLQWVVKGAVDVNIGANPSAEGGGEDEGVDDQAVKVVDIVDTFRLQVGFTKFSALCKLLRAI